MILKIRQFLEDLRWWLHASLNARLATPIWRWRRFWGLRRLELRMLFLLLRIGKGKFKVAFQRALMLVLQFGIRLLKGRNLTSDKGNLTPDFRDSSPVCDHAIKGFDVFCECHNVAASDASSEGLSNQKNVDSNVKQTPGDMVKVRLQNDGN